MKLKDKIKICHIAAFVSTFFATMENAIYIGAGHDTKPIKALKYINKFIYIDTLPYDSNDPYKVISETPWREQYINEFSDKIKHDGFYLLDDGSTARIEYKKQQQRFEYIKDTKSIIYYFNTDFPSQISSKIQDEISQADTLIIAGFFPDKNILDYMKKPIHIICFAGTIYSNDEDDDTIITWLYDNPNSTDIADITFFDYELKKHSFNTISDLELFNQEYE